MTNKITVNGEYTAEELRKMADNIPKGWPYVGCKYWVINRHGYTECLEWDGGEHDLSNMNLFGIYKEKPSAGQVKMVMRRRKILQTWEIPQFIYDSDNEVLFIDANTSIMTAKKVKEFEEVMSYPYTHHTVK